MSLYVVATPIGNLEDISQRAITILSQAELILAEDTSHSIRLLKAYNITTPLKRFDAYREKQLHQDKKLLSLLKKDSPIALISDAGSPVIADPGKSLIQFCHQQRIRVVPIPGPCALISALSISGFDADSFFFGGYLPRTHAARRSYLQKYHHLPMTSVFYEVPQRIHKTFEDLRTIWGEDRRGLLARELTKMHEYVVNGTIADIYDSVQSQQIRGEIVLVLEGKQQPNNEWQDEDERVLRLLLKDLPLKKAVQSAATLRNKNKNLFYSQALKIAKE